MEEEVGIGDTNMLEIVLVELVRVLCTIQFKPLSFKQQNKLAKLGRCVSWVSLPPLPPSARLTRSKSTMQ